MDKVKFYSASDLICGHQLLKAESIMNSFDSNKYSYDINEIVEFYNISEYIDAEVYLKSWSIEDINKFKVINNRYKGLIGKYLGSISDNNFEDLFNRVEGNYKSDFWNLVEKYKVYEKISYNIFYELLMKSKVRLYEILKYKKIVNYHVQAIKEKLMLDECSAELLLNKYEIDRDNTKSELYFPKELNEDDKEKIILNYINSAKPNLNYLHIIVNVQSTSEFRISDRTRLQAMKRVKEEESNLFNVNTGIYMETTVLFSENQEEAVKKEIEGENWKFSYNLAWIKENNDYNTLMNNFIYLFEFVDFQMRVTLVNKLQEMGVFEQRIFMCSKNAYAMGLAFNRKNVLSNLQMTSYYHQLNCMGIRLEEIIEWFFKIYVLKEFNIKEFRIKMPSEHSQYIEKCRAILPEMEYVLKQFSMFVEDGTIDQELLRISSGHLLYKDVPSLFKKKYVYGNGEEFKQVTYYLFSDQCMLSYIDRIGSEYNNFFDLLINEEITIDDYKEYHKIEIEWLIKYKYIELNSEGYIKICNINRIYVLKDLYKNEVINYLRYNLKLQEVIDDMKKQGLVEFQSTLFSRPEQDYINYHLNKASFNNALDLRNMYSHGTQPSDEKSEDVHKSNYIIFLKLLIFIIIKINDEFCMLYKE